MDKLHSRFLGSTEVYITLPDIPVYTAKIRKVQKKIKVFIHVEVRSAEYYTVRPLGPQAVVEGSGSAA